MKRTLPTWCKEVKKSMIDDDLNVTELAERVGLSRNYVSGVAERARVRAGDCKDNQQRSQHHGSLYGKYHLITLYRTEEDR